MARTYRVICGKSPEAVRLLAENDGRPWKVLEPIREFNGIDSEDDGTFTDFGGFVTHKLGFVALCYKDI